MNFSYTNPNALCPICGKKVFFYQNSNGSQVYFDELGKPWPKHGCYEVIDTEIIPDCIDNSMLVNNISHPSQDYFPVEVISIKRLIEKYYLIEVQIDTDVIKLVVENPPYSLGLTFIERINERYFISGFDKEEYYLESIDYDSFIRDFDHLFHYEIGTDIEITIDSKNELGMRTEIFINKPFTKKKSFKNRAFVYNSTLSSYTKDLLKRDGVVKIKATSKLTRDNEVIFTEVLFERPK